MKPKVAIVLLVVVCIGLGIALLTHKRTADAEKLKRDEDIAGLRNNLQEVSRKLEEQNQKNMSLEGDLKTRAEELSSLSNNLNKVIANMEKSDAQAKATADQLRAAQAELQKKDAKIGELETERDDLTKKMAGLNISIGDLEKQIASTERKLATAEGDKDFLLKELKRLQAEKAALERQFNDLAVLRAQVSKLKEDLAISRRLEFIRLNLFGVTAKGGAEKLMQHVDKNPASSMSNYGLNVEMRQRTGARVMPPMPPTNSPASNAPVPNVAPGVTNPPAPNAAAPPK